MKALIRERLGDHLIGGLIATLVTIFAFEAMVDYGNSDWLLLPSIFFVVYLIVDGIVTSKNEERIWLAAEAAEKLAVRTFKSKLCMNCMILDEDFKEVERGRIGVCGTDPISFEADRQRLSVERNIELELISCINVDALFNTTPAG